VTITVEIWNLGTEDVTNAQVQVDLDGAAYWNTQVSVQAGSSTRTSFTWVSTVGSHVFQVTIDPNHLLNETNRGNSVATFNVWIHN
jgi:subtilase family serine protease